MARIPTCEFKDGGCDDGRCKIGVCILEVDERRADGARVSAHREKVRKKLISLFADPAMTPAEIDDLVADSLLWERAERWVLYEEGRGPYPGFRIG